MAEKNFFDFMLDAQRDWNLLKAFLSAKDEKSLREVLKNYHISPEDLQKILKLREDKWGIGITEGPLQY
jgi:hypothetical protein